MSLELKSNGHCYKLSMSRKSLVPQYHFFGFGALIWTVLSQSVKFYFCLTESSWLKNALPYYLYIALFTELFDLAGGNISVLITVSTLVESQASANSAFSWSCKKENTQLYSAGSYSSQRSSSDTSVGVQ